jgi:uncharacterized protein CXXCG
VRFWRLHHPPTPSEAAARLLNGELTHPFRLPGVKCGECGKTWGGSRILPYSLSEALQRKVELRQPWPIDDDAHRRLRDEVLRDLRAAGASIEALRPGDAFQPAVLDVAAPPDADFLWSAESVVVSQRMHAVLTTVPLRGVSFAPVTIRTGRRTHADRRDSGVMAEATGISAPVYYEMIIRAESGYPPGVDPVRYCGSCGRRTYNHEQRQLVMRPEMWKGEPVLLLATTLWIVVTDPVKQMIEVVQPTNVEFVSLEGG